MRSFILTFLLLIAGVSLAQDAELIAQKGIGRMEEGRLEEAISSFNEALQLNPYIVAAWVNRGIAYMRLGEMEKAVADMDSALAREPGLANAWLNKGTARRYMGDPRASLTDYDRALEIDPEYARAWFNRGLAYEALGLKDSACADYHQAHTLGLSEITDKLRVCTDSSAGFKPVHMIYRLNGISTDPEYGLTAQKPIKVGSGPNGGPANERDYLGLLRDGRGKPVSFKRLGSCCAYPSDNGFMGLAMLDRYKVVYRTAKGKKAKAVLYISMYDHVPPQAPVGFGSLR